jgi:hypothetical protein
MNLKERLEWSVILEYEYREEILSQLNALHIPTTYFRKIYFSVILWMSQAAGFQRFFALFVLPIERYIEMAANVSAESSKHCNE